MKTKRLNLDELHTVNGGYRDSCGGYKVLFRHALEDFSIGGMIEAAIGMLGNCL